MSNPRWQGIFPAVTTKFHADESIDAEGTARHIDFQIRNGIHGLVTCGSLGEASTLTLEEKLQVAKIALVLVAARLFTDFREGQYTVLVFFALVGLLVLAPVLIILGPQSDLGTAMICVVGILAVMWLGEVPLRTMLIVIGVVVALGLVGIFGSSYRRDRLMVFMNPWNDGEGGFGTGFQLILSLYSLSGGGLFGVGLGNSHDKYL